MIVLDHRGKRQSLMPLNVGPSPWARATRPPMDVSVF